MSLFQNDVEYETFHKLHEFQILCRFQVLTVKISDLLTTDFLSLF